MLTFTSARRLVQLHAGLLLYGFSIALLLRADLGLNPWNVFHQGVAFQSGLNFGTVLLFVGGIVLLLWVPLRQRPGVGTVSNILVVGTAADASLHVLRAPEDYALRVGMLAFGIVLNGAAGGAYIGAGLGPGPRDGLMTGLVRTTGRSIRLVSTTIELSVLSAGWLLGGTVGIGTVLYAMTIGWLVQFFLQRLDIRNRGSSELKEAHAPDS